MQHQGRCWIPWFRFGSTASNGPRRGCTYTIQSPRSRSPKLGESINKGSRATIVLSIRFCQHSLFLHSTTSSIPLTARRLQVLAVVLGDGDGLGLGGSGSSLGGGGDAPARAGGGVVLIGSAVLDVGGDGLVVTLLKGLDVALELGGLVSVDGDGDGGGDSLGGDSGLLEAGAVGLAGLNGLEVTAGTSDGTVAVVAVAAGTHLEGTSHGRGGEGQNGEDLHLDCGGYVFCLWWRKEEYVGIVESEDGGSRRIEYWLRGMGRRKRREREEEEDGDGSTAGCYI
jgi:hypothetical protein